MATSGSKSVAVATGVTLKFGWEVSSQSVANNTSKVAWKMQVVTTTGNISSSASKDWSVTVNGTKYSGTNTLGSISTNTTKTLASGSTTITHTDDGTKSFSYSFSQEFAITYSGSSIGTISGSSSGTLPTIARASSFSATNANIGNATTITINRKSDSFTHSFLYMIDGQSSYTAIVSKTTAASSYKWTIPDDAYKYISNAKVKIYLKCRTYSGSTKIGESVISITATATAVSTIKAGNAYIGNTSTFVITSKSSKYTHTLQYLINGQSSYTTIVSKTSNTNYLWTIPEGAYKYISSGKVTITIKCITYSDSTKIGSSTTTLTASAKAQSTVAATSAYIGNKPTITITRNSSSFKHTLQYKISGQSSYTDIVSKTTSTSYSSWAIPTDAYNYVGSTSKTVTITINCITYYGDVNLGSKTTTLTATCKESVCKPTISPTINDTGSVSTKLTGDGANIVIKNYNVMTYSIGASGKYGATITSQKITCGDKSSTTATGKLGYVNSNKFTITATDSRGYSNSTTVTKKTLINYVKPTATLKASATLDGNSETATVDFTVNGNWYNGSFGAVTNALTVQYRYKTNSGSYGDWTTITATKSGNTYTATGSLTGLNYKNTYTVQARAYDAINTNGDTTSSGYIESGAISIKAQPVFDWDGDDFNFNVPVYHTDTVHLPSSNYYDYENNIGGGLNAHNSDICGVNGIYFNDTSNDNAEGILFKRENGNWDSLRVIEGRLYLVQNHPDGTYKHPLLYTVGDTMSLSSNTPLTAYLTDGSTDMFITIPVNKPMLVNGCTVSGNIVCRGVAGYLYSAADADNNVLSLSSPNGFTVASVTVKATCIVIKLEFDSKVLNSSGGTYTNNTPVAACSYGTLTFTFN